MTWAVAGFYEYSHETKGSVFGKDDVQDWHCMRLHKPGLV